VHEVRSRHDSEVPALLAYVGYWGKTGKHLLVPSFTGLDPNRSSTAFNIRISDVGTSAGFANHSGLILAARITFAHLAVSDLMTTANSSGELRDASRPSCAIRSRTSACTAICTMSACTLLTTAAGVPAGANSPNQEMASKSGKPDSASVWQFGNDRRALERRDGKAAQLAIANQRQDRAHVHQRHGHTPADHVGEDRAAIGNMDDVDASEALE